ncbi:MAG TPA: NAD(P)H-dependent oxidoreductase [Tepidisphaeraceae bacterium]|nr:NAD(P)H-dependent oxidoreductase [Tepidisphaeraceae bacterium]
MSFIDPDSLVNAFHFRYATKKFDPTRKISENDWNAIRDSTILAPSSYGLQPWKLIVLTDQKMKDELPALTFNQQQPKDCSHFVVFTVLKEMSETYVDKYVDRIVAVRGVPRESLAPMQRMIANQMAMSKGQHSAWSSNQAYLALGFMLAAAALLKIDACPMEGFDSTAYNRFFGLDKSDYTTICACALGYRASDDRFASVKKVRFDVNDLVQSM